MVDATSETPGWTPAIAATLAMVLISMDLFMTPVATTALGRSFGTDAGFVQMAISLYSLIFAALTILGGKLGDIYGKKKVFVLGLILYGVAAAITTFAPTSLIMLIGFAFVRAPACALMIPASVALIVANYQDERRRGTAFSMYGIGAMIAGLLAPTLMGFMADTLSWRVPYALEIPIVLAAILLTRGVRETATVKTAVDGLGTVLTFLAIGAIVLGGMLGGRYGWWDARRPFEFLGGVFNPLTLSPTALLLMMSAVLLVLLTAHMWRQGERGRPALFSMRLFDNRVFLVAFLMCVVFFLLNGALPFIVPVFLQEAVKFDGSRTGMVMTIFMVGSMVGSMASGPLIARMQPRVLLQLALAVIAAGFVALFGASSPAMGLAAAAVPMFIVGLGFGVVVAQLPNVQLSTLPDELQGEGSGLAETSKEVGVGLGTAVIGSILFGLAFSNMVDGAALQAKVELSTQERAQLILQVEDQRLPADVEKFIQENVPNIQDVMQQAYVDGFRTTLGILIGIVALAFVIASLIPNFGTAKPKSPDGKPGTVP
jgi:MFS family permease